MANRLCPGSLDWDTFWSLDGEQLAAFTGELNAHINELNKQRKR